LLSGVAEATMMRHGLTIALLMVILAPGGARAQSDAEDFYRRWVDYRNGELSLEFDRTPVVFALHAIQAKTGFQIVIPASSEARLVNFRLWRQPLEPAIRSLISTIGYDSFALLYDGNGRPSRAVVLNAQPAARPIDETVKTAAGQPLSAAEREKLQNDLSRWRELKAEERSRVEARLKDLPAGEEREQLVGEYGRRMLELER
jgi:hypothetical protein